MNILAIGAHFDDIELGCGGALAKHVSSGDIVYAYVATKSGFINYQNKEIRSNEIANKEGKKAMKILGINLINGNFNTLEVEFDDNLNIEILRIIEEKKIDLVYSHWVGDIHHDHLSVARASLHTCRHISRHLMYRSNWYHSTFEFKGNFYVDITEFWEIKKKAIEAHESEMKRTGEKWIQYFYNESCNLGSKIGVEKAEVFEVVKWLN